MLRRSKIVRKHRRIVGKASKLPQKRRRRRKGELTKLKAELWQICRQIKSSTTCFTCGRANLVGSNRQLGHYIASSLCSPELRYDLKNLEIQCYNCNINKSGNTIQFQINLVKNNGKQFIEELWERNVATKGKAYTSNWFQEKIKQYSDILATQTTP